MGVLLFCALMLEEFYRRLKSKKHSTTKQPRLTAHWIGGIPKLEMSNRN
jgi:hypothetical protein